MLTEITLPAGGTISYGYTTFSDSYSNKMRWLSSRATVNGTWSYSPQVISTCSSSQVGCQQKVTVRKPYGESTAYTFTLNNGAWPVQIQTYDSSSNLLTAVTNTYDFSQPCQYSGCNGAALIRLLTSQTTTSTPSGSITKQTRYTYDSPQTGNVTALKEWRYYLGTSPRFPSIPDRATYTSYLTTGVNDINRPLSITICNNSGSDSACPGGGSRVQQTLYVYDSYSSCGGLAPVTGAMNHDDTNFGTGYTTRGNPTQIQQWVTGSTYLTTQLCYDSTGQITQQADPKGNVTAYGYGDKLYSDNGSNSPPVYTPSKPTNAYLTSVTEPLIGTASFGYYYGSGHQAFVTDPNGATSYSHFMDPFDRSTENDYALVGWDKTVYTSATQADLYVAIGDTTPSTTCVSCQHKQNTLDGYGRRVTQKLINSSGTTVSEVSTNYDAESRVAQVSNPYASGSPVFESYSYDGLDRTVAVKHPDNQVLQSAYGAQVATYGGVANQQGSAAVYGYGYPVLVTDESGKQKQEWLDGFGRVIELDEPSVATTPGTGTVTIGGTEKQKYQCIPGCQPGCNAKSCNSLIWDHGTVLITVGNSFTLSVSYGQGSTDASLASALAAAFDFDGNSPVTATSNGAVVTFTGRDAVNYSLSASAQSGVSGPASFTTTTSGATMTGAAGGISSSPVVSNYLYDAADRLTQVVQGVQTRSFAYDGLGRPTSLTTPEAGTDILVYLVSGSPCSGEPGNVCQKMDARGVVASYFYDALNRFVGKSYSIPNGSNVATMPNVCTTSTGVAANVCYFYDQGGASTYALGRPTQMVDPSGSESYVYDKAGRVSQITKLVGTIAYSINYQFNAGDEVTQISYPSGRVVQQSYTSVGWLCEIAPSTSSCGSAATPFATGYTYDAAGDVLELKYGNGIYASFGYSSSRLQLNCLDYSPTNRNGNCAHDATTKYGLGYWYQWDSTNCAGGTNVGNNGQIQCITDTVDSGRTVSYTYDVVGRLGTAVTNGSTNFPKWGLSWSYDRYANRLCQTLTAGSGYQGCLSFANPGGAQTNHPDGWCFDASGNLISKTASQCPSPVPTFQYDGENRMVSDSGATFVYDGNGTRVRKCVPNCTSPSSSTVYIYAGQQDIAEYDNSAAPSSPSREFIWTDAVPGSGLLATITGGSSPQTTYFHGDHLDWRVSTDGTSGSPTYGQVIGQQGHYPFGDSWYSTNGNEFVFTSYQRDPESGLDYAMARYYDSSAGRFCSADPLGGQLEDPQTWNRYAYVRNDPINLVDPSGQGFLTWLFDALAILTDVLTAGTAAPETAPAFGLDLSSMGLFVANVQALQQTSKEIQPQGIVVPPPMNLLKTKSPQPTQKDCISLKPALIEHSRKYNELNKPVNPGEGGAISHGPVTPESAAVSPRQFGMTKGMMSALRKQGKGITGTVYNEDGSTIPFSVDDRIADAKNPQNAVGKIRQANKANETIVELEGIPYKDDKGKDLPDLHRRIEVVGVMVKCPPGTKQK